jgi:hypothetical protein
MQAHEHHSEGFGLSVPPINAPFEARIAGGRVIISANVDLKGLRMLRKQILLLEQMLTLTDDEEDSAFN